MSRLPHEMNDVQGGRRGMSETIQFTTATAAEKTALVEKLNDTIAATSCAVDIRYFEEMDAIRIREELGDAVFIGCENMTPTAILHEAFRELGPFLLKSLYREGYNKSFGSDRLRRSSDS